jgi:hypothetical protein
MRKMMLSLLLLAAPSLALPGVTRSRPPARIYHVAPSFTVANGSTPVRYVYPHAAGARLVDVIVYQVVAGTVGTSWTVLLRNAAGTAVTATSGVITVAAGAHVALDAAGNLPDVAGCTRPALKTDATVDIAKGGFIDVYTTETGSYTVHPIAVVVLVFEPRG